MRCVPLPDADAADDFGQKAVSLGAALRARLPVPEGYALCAALVEALARGEVELPEALAAFVAERPVAARSSAVGEDSARASFAGLHATELNVMGAGGLRAALGAVLASAHHQAAQLYRRRLGVDGDVRVGAVVQRMVAADVAGVLFTRDPVSGREEMVLEATWGLGEAVVSGRVTPDLVRADSRGRVLERRAGHKDVAIRPSPRGGTEEVLVPGAGARALCLDDGAAAAVFELARRCQEVFGPALDIEWAIRGADVLLLQCRPITR